MALATPITEFPRVPCALKQSHLPSGEYRAPQSERAGSRSMAETAFSACGAAAIGHEATHRGSRLPFAALPMMAVSSRVQSKGNINSACATMRSSTAAARRMRSVLGAPPHVEGQRLAGPRVSDEASGEIV